MNNTNLEEHRCLECNTPVKVPLIHPYEGDEKPTGMSLHFMDDHQNTHLVGVLCMECAFRLCREGVIGISYGGFPHSWEADLNTPHKFPFVEENEIPCRCDICMEEEEEFWRHPLR